MLSPLLYMKATETSRTAVQLYIYITHNLGYEYIIIYVTVGKYVK